MIQISDPKKCCGCYGCSNICPKKCISMHPDIEGFYYPSVNKSLCIDCGLCEAVCPVINRLPQQQMATTKVLACRNREEQERLKSSSGGVFSLLAAQTISEGGIVFAAAFDSNFTVRHSAFTTIDELPKYRGSKYLPSHIGECYSQAATELKTGRKVMFTGTHCQIAGLRHFLRSKEYANLLAVEIICHGVPSPVVFAKYLSEAVKADRIDNISFRDKSNGWVRYSLKIDYTTAAEQHSFVQPAYINQYQRGFIKGLYLRPSCYDCPSKNFVSGCDITMGDYWGLHSINTDIDDNKGVSMVLTYNTKAQQAIAAIAPRLDLRDGTIESALKYNGAICKSTAKHPSREEFFGLLQSRSFMELADRFVGKPQAKASIWTRVGWKLQAIKKKLLS